MLDGHDLRDLKLTDLRRQIVVVDQDPFIFNTTVAENIRYARPDASEADVVAAARAAGLGELLDRLPQGINTPVGERGRALSAGERQRVTIARAFLANPPMLILDEATSSVDTRTEMQLQRAMEQLMRGRTSFVIAHRLSTIQEADRILVMNQGRIVEQGRHDELLAGNGFYAELYNSQFLGATIEQVG